MGRFELIDTLQGTELPGFAGIAERQSGLDWGEPRNWLPFEDQESPVDPM